MASNSVSFVSGTKTNKFLNIKTKEPPNALAESSVKSASSVADFLTSYRPDEDVCNEEETTSLDLPAPTKSKIFIINTNAPLASTAANVEKEKLKPKTITPSDDIITKPATPKSGKHIRALDFDKLSSTSPKSTTKSPQKNRSVKALFTTADNESSKSKSWDTQLREAARNVPPRKVSKRSTSKKRKSTTKAPAPKKTLDKSGNDILSKSNEVGICRTCIIF